MLTRLVRLQVTIFVVIALLGVSYVGAKYVGLHKMLWDSGYTVTARFATSGGMFTNSEVTYRGVTVGRVGELRLTEAGMEADLDIDPSAPEIPADLTAVVASRSAAGEQYVDLRPRQAAGPMLTEGSVIEQADTDVPLSVDAVLGNLDLFVESVPKESLRIVVDELYEATSGAGPNLEVLLDSGIDFIETATEHIPDVTSLVTDADTVLTTQVEQSDAIRSFARNAALLAAQLKKSDSDIRELIPAVAPAAREVTQLVRQSGPNLGVLMANLLSTSTVLEVRQRGLEQLLVMTPQAIAAGSSVVRADGAHFGLALTFSDPPPCTSGYGSTPYRNGLDTSGGGPLNTAAHCSLPKGDITGVRGSRNAPRPGR
ncbi:phospholipid/cholesterol/gamma-HCH transport system substrate-binding protein [Amycolatopsis marina]|uniref:Phospholipid/cholesterol/gamma-HCH transport system substrate-binding protein n=1 Tax=Amycolatopsis marina TaxID=490629 RepID=A0A1I1CR45_9PSEU|nr:MlaD family protein [Amycolatopsis marina]SFB62903.1 phospholipid/cholesterol/gamma-HCH transport system substrate-binding protein [Amycolatopsis marina]